MHKKHINYTLKSNKKNYKKCYKIIKVLSLNLIYLQTQKWEYFPNLFLKFIIITNLKCVFKY